MGRGDDPGCGRTGLQGAVVAQQPALEVGWRKAVLLECTLAGLATCTLTHMIEVTPARDAVRRLIRRHGAPQLLVRVGRPVGQRPPATPRLPVSEVLEFRD